VSALYGMIGGSSMQDEGFRECAHEHSLNLRLEDRVEEGGMYQCEATSVMGFIQQLACAYIRSGYVRVACGVLPEGKDAARFDAKQVERYRLDGMTARMRWKRRREGLANVQYLRHGQVFVILVSDGHRDVFEREEGRIARDLRERPMLAFGYSLRVANGHVQVRIADREYEALRVLALDLAARQRSADKIAEVFRRLPLESYAPVRGQLFGLLAAVNQQRKRAGLDLVPIDAIRKRRRIVRPFEPLAVTPNGAEEAKAA
jgi:hypothetical protein